VVPGMIKEGVMLAAGKSGLGKSWWALQLAIAVAQGGKAFNAIDVEQGDVLYLSLEDDKDQMQERLNLLLEEGEDYPARLTIAHEAPLLSRRLSERLEAWLKTHPEARLIIVDVLQKIRPHQDPKGNLYEQDYRIGEALKPLARRYHVAIILLHHCNKLVNPEDPLDAISGSTGLIAPADIKAVFMRARGRAQAKLFITGRGVREQWAAFEFEEGVWTYLGDAQEAERSEARQAIVGLLQTASGPMTPAAIAERLGKKRSTVRVLLMRMVDRGEVKSPQQGYYVAPQVATPTPTASPPPPSPPPSPPINSVNSVNGINSVNSINRLEPAALEDPSVYGAVERKQARKQGLSTDENRENGEGVSSVYGVYGGTGGALVDANSQAHTVVDTPLLGQAMGQKVPRNGTHREPWTFPTPEGGQAPKRRRA
jgi:AAA domain/IclR helix-turn-helix domain